MSDNKELEGLLAAAKARVDAMTPSERAEMHRAQRLSYVRGELMFAYPDMTLEEADARARQAESFVINGTTPDSERSGT